jgi:hypothetical protein
MLSSHLRIGLPSGLLPYLLYISRNDWAIVTIFSYVDRTISCYSAAIIYSYLPSVVLTWWTPKESTIVKVLQINFGVHILCHVF